MPHILDSQSLVSILHLPINFSALPSFQSSHLPSRCLVRCRHFFKLICGIGSVALSVMWVVHLLLYVFISPPPTLFLNSLFMELDEIFALLGTRLGLTLATLSKLTASSDRTPFPVDQVLCRMAALHSICFFACSRG